MKIDPLERNDDWLADEYWAPDEDDFDDEEFVEQSEETIKEMSDES